MKLIKLSELKEIGVTGSPEIKKKVILEKDIVSNIMTFGQATFKPGQKKQKHRHETAFEVFYIQEGKVKFIFEDREVVVKKDEVIIVQPGELHSQENPYQKSVTWIYFIVSSD